MVAAVLRNIIPRLTACSCANVIDVVEMFPDGVVITSVHINVGTIVIAIVSVVASVHSWIAAISISKEPIRIRV